MVMRRSCLFSWIHAVLVAAGMVSSFQARALIFSSTGDTNYNTTAPTGALAGSGWQWQGQWKTATGIPIAPHFFISAGHLGGRVGDTFLFDGVTYTTVARNASPTSDLIVWEVSGTFPTYAPIYVRNDEVGRSAVLFGRGVTRGSEVNVSGLGESPLRGWRWSPNATGGTLRWGENTIQDARDFPANDPYTANGELLVMDFDRYDGTNPNEVTLASLDSGGGLFLWDAFDNQWKLAGVNVDAEYAFRITATGSDIFASIFDMGGLFYDEEGDTVGPVGPDPFVYAANAVTDLPSHLYSVRLSANAGWIRGVAAVPPLNTAPLFPAVANRTVQELAPLEMTLPASDVDQPAQTLTFKLESGPSGLTVTSGGVLRWTPDETQGGFSFLVSVSVSDSGYPTLGATNQFWIEVQEGNSAPQLTDAGTQTADEFIPFAFQLNATDSDLPSNNLFFELVAGPPGLSISSSGLLRWTPDDSAGGATYPVTVRVSDDGSPSLSSTGVISIQVADSTALSRTLWQIGTDSPSGTAVTLQFAEFSLQNNVNDLRPGKVTRVPEDPAYPGAELNPGADDDFYFGGIYPAGFNNLPEVLRVPFDEPPSAWERAHTLGDRTNRVHFLLGSAQTTAEVAFRLTVDLPSGGFSVGGVNQKGFADHDYAVRFRNGAGMTTLLYSNRISKATILMLDFTASQVSATPGGNSLEFVRTGPAAAGVSYWIIYDYIQLEVLPTNAPPQMTAVPNQAVDEGIPMAFALAATDPDGPAAGLVFSLVSGPPGLTVSSSGFLSWIPKETQGGTTYPVVVAVTDSGVIPKSATTQFLVGVGDVPQLDRTVWQLGVDSPLGASNGTLWGEFSMQNNKNDARPGLVSRLPGDPVYDASPASNPSADDDFYFGGSYPAGFNSLTSLLRVPNDEPFWAWERAHTLGDRTNRVHFVLGTPLVTGAAKFRLTVDLPSASWSVGGVTQPGFGDHDFVVAFVNGAGARTVLFSGRLSQSTNLVLNFTAEQVAATFGANSLELIRVGPSDPSTSYWIAYDQLRFESVP